MKKFAALILLLLYFNSSMGIPMHAHYCMGKVVSLGIGYSSPGDKCENCGMHQKKGCCEDKHTTIKVSEKYKPVTYSPYDSNLWPIIPNSSSEDKQPYKSSQLKTFSPFLPRYKSAAKYKLNCVFLV